MTGHARDEHDQSTYEEDDMPDTYDERAQVGELALSSTVVAADRPVPIRDAFRSVGSAVGFAGSVLTALVGYGVLSAAQGDAAVSLLGLIPGVVTAVTVLLTAFGVRARAEPLTTPVADPVDDAGRPLTP